MFYIEIKTNKTDTTYIEEKSNEKMEKWSKWTKCDFKCNTQRQRSFGRARKNKKDYLLNVFFFNNNI